jgi:putative IMPACT (imprinted ancient) family translation regulator
MEELAVIKLIINKSRFYAHFYKIDKKDDIDNIINLHKLKYKKAKHHCYAYRNINKTNNQIEESFKNDREVGHPGRVLLDLLKKYNFESNAIVVSRIFGGIKLGVGGVSRAFKNAGEDVIKYYLLKK